MQALVFDFARLLLFPRDQSYPGSLNDLHDKLSQQKNYHFLNHFSLNLELLNFLTLHTGQCRKFIYTAGDIQDTPEVQKYTRSLFEKIFTAPEIGPKNSADSFNHLATLLNLPPSEIFFADNSLDNVKAAESAGYIVHLYQHNPGLINHLKELFHLNRRIYVR